MLAVPALLCALSGVAQAACGTNQQSCSPGYGVNEVFFGTGGELNACSTGPTGYCSKQSAGELGVGNTSSGNQYQAQAGFNTDRVPSLTFIVNAASINLGTLNPGTPATAIATFSVESYLASGYQVTTESPSPKNGSYTMQTPSSPSFSAPTTEQFGMNLAVNNSCGGGLPASLGAAPVQKPDSTFSFGAATANYNQPCKFMYADHDVIATSSSSSGETDYTISYIFNTTNLTPGGTYTFNQVLVATSTF